TKGIPPAALYHQALGALLPMWLCVFFYFGLYREGMLSAYDELVQVLKAVFFCALLTTAMTFAYRGAEYSRLVIGLWAAGSAALVYALREVDKAIFRRLMVWISGPHHVLIIGHGKTVEVIREMTAHQPFVKTSVLDSLPGADEFEKETRE